MGRESRFDLQPNSWYPTDRRALAALLPHLPPRTVFVEPCAGDGRLVRWLEEAGHICIAASDIEPRRQWIKQAAGCKAVLQLHEAGPCIITNPPYTPRELMHELLGVWLGRGWPCWLLIDATWMQTRQAAEWLKHCSDIVAAGRMKMFEGSADSGKKDHCWFHFTPALPTGWPTFWPLGVRGLYQTPVDDAAVAAGDAPPPASTAMLVSGEASRPERGRSGEVGRPERGRAPPG